MAWLIGDIHGCLTELSELLSLIPPGDQLVFLGDYIDRGPNSAGCIDRVMREQQRSIFLMGNHEQMMLLHFNSPHDPRGGSWTLKANGGLETLQSYGLDNAAEFTDLPTTHRAFLAGLKSYYEGSDFIAVHAGIDPFKPDLQTQDEEDLLWIRHHWIKNEAEWKGKRVYYGHTPSRYYLGPERQHEPITGENSLGIDTGCVYGGSLTAVNSETGGLIQVPAKRPYW